MEKVSLSSMYAYGSSFICLIHICLRMNCAQYFVDCASTVSVERKISCTFVVHDGQSDFDRGSSAHAGERGGHFSLATLQRRR